MLLKSYDNIIASNQLMKPNCKITIVVRIIIRFSGFVVIWCII